MIYLIAVSVDIHLLSFRVTIPLIVDSEGEL